MVPRYRLDFIASLARQMAFVPAAVREKQLQAAETLLLEVDPAKAYPPAYVVFRVTAFRPETPPTDQATGLALQHDLGLLIESVSETLDDHTADRAEPVLQIDDLVAQFNVTSKTIQRWRRRGLAARRFVFPDGKRRVGFRLSVVEQFFAAHRHSLQGTVNCTRIVDDEWSIICRHTRRLAADLRRPVDEIAARVGRIVGRTALAIEAELRKHDAECLAENLAQCPAGHSEAALMAGRAASACPGAVATVVRLHADRLPLNRVAAEAGLPRSTAYRILLAERVARTVGRRIKFLDDPLYHQPDAESVVDALVAQQPLGTTRVGEPPMRGLSSELAALCAHPVLSPTQERALFLQYNFRKFQAAQARHRLDPARVCRRQLARVDRLLARATAVRNEIVRSNLRLVVAVGKKHVRPGITLPELVNEGSLTLMRAAESFDTRRGHKFSTYATLALMKGFARTVGRLRSGPVVFGLGAVAERVADAGRSGIERVDAADRVERLLAPLADTDRATLYRQFGFEHAAASLPVTRSGGSSAVLRQLRRSAVDD